MYHTNNQLWTLDKFSSSPLQWSPGKQAKIFTPFLSRSYSMVQPFSQHGCRHWVTPPPFTAVNTPRSFTSVRSPRAWKQNSSSFITSAPMPAFKKKLEPQGTAASSECRGILWWADHTHGCAHTTLGDPTPAMECPKAMDLALQVGSNLMCSSMRGWKVFIFNYFGCAGVRPNTMLSPLSAYLMS